MNTKEVTKTIMTYLQQKINHLSANHYIISSLIINKETKKAHAEFRTIESNQFLSYGLFKAINRITNSDIIGVELVEGRLNLFVEFDIKPVLERIEEEKLLNSPAGSVYNPKLKDKVFDRINKRSKNG